MCLKLKIFINHRPAAPHRRPGGDDGDEGLPDGRDGSGHPDGGEEPRKVFDF